MSEIKTYRVELVVQTTYDPSTWDWHELVASEEDGCVVSVRQTELVGVHPCRYCGRDVVETADGWVDPNATGDDFIWFHTCEGNDTFPAEHEVTA